MNRTQDHPGCSRPIGLVAKVGLVGLVGLILVAVGGCWRESHVLGDGLADGGPQISSAGDGSGDTLNDTGHPPPIPPPALPDLDGGAGAGNATVVSLGDVGSSGWPIAIAPAEVASRLSLLLLRQPASAALTAAVVASAPRTNEDVGKLTDGLLLEDGSLAGRQAFYRWWLNFDEFLIGARDASLFPGLTEKVRQALVDGTMAFIEDVTWRPTGDLATLLSEPTAFVSNATAPWFPGVVVPAGAATRVSLDAGAYAGIVTQPAVVTIYDYPYRADPTMRGMQVRRTYLCQDLPPIPPGERSGGTFGAGVTIRQGVSVSVANTGCEACHRLTDAVGFAFGHFDAVGAYQDTEGGLPVDTTGTLTSTSVDPAPRFAGPVALAATLAGLPEVRTCYAVKWLLFASGRTPQAYATNVTYATPSGDDVKLVSDAAYVVKRATFPGGRLSLRGTIRALTETHTFLDP